MVTRIASQTGFAFRASALDQARVRETVAADCQNWQEQHQHQQKGQHQPQ